MNRKVKKMFEEMEDETLQKVLGDYIEKRDWYVVAALLRLHGEHLFTRSTWYKEAVGQKLVFSV
jgi:hypothetical protein